MGGLFLLLIDVINAEERTGERGDLSKTDKERLVDLSLWVDKDSTKEHYQSPDREGSCGSELGNIFGCFIHKRFLNPVQRYNKKTKPPKNAAPFESNCAFYSIT